METKKIFLKKILSDSSILLILNMFASALNYVYQILLSNILSVESFGTVNTIFSVMLVIAVPGTTITMLAARYLAIYRENRLDQAAQGFVKNLTITVTWLGVVVIVCGVLLRGCFQSFLKIDDTLIIIITITICALGYYHPLYSGCMSGLKKFLPLGIYALLIPIYKMIGLAIATPIGNEYYRLLICLFTFIPGSIITAFAGYTYIKKIVYKNETHSLDKLEMPEMDQWMNSLVLNIGLVLYMNIDILAVRYIGGAQLSGIYSSVVLFGRIIYYGATSIGTVLLPMVATRKKEDAFVLLKNVLLIVGGASIAGLFLLYIVKEPVILVIYGEAYLGAAEYIIYVSLISFVIGLLTIMINFFVGIDYVTVPRNVLIVLSIVIISAVFILKDVTVALLVIGISGVICVAWMLIRYKADCR